MYRIMPEKQIGSRTVSNCAWSCFDQYANLLPSRLLSVKLKYPSFFYDFLICFISFDIILLKPEFFHVNLSFKREKLWGNVVFTTMVICIYFASLELHIPLHSADFAEDKNVAFDFWDWQLAFLGTLFILTIKIF